MKSKFTYVGIRVKSMRKSLDFYTRFLGMKDKGHTRIEVSKGDIAYLESEEMKVGIELNHYDADSPFNTKYVVGEGLDHLAFGVKDLDKALKRAKKLGYRLRDDIKTEKSRWAYVEDPNGIWIELFKTDL
ncbi:MAG: VOC family protein [Thaumarchaeota archaeon]|nr:VOC family protein [Nitrososphaerota archaeon]